MEEIENKQYKFRKWPLFVPAYLIFTIGYYFVFSENNWADSLIWAIFFLSYPLLAYFYLKVVKIKFYTKLGIDLIFAWFIGSILMYILAMTYMSDLEWFGFIALLFYFFVYLILMQFASFIIFKLKSKKHKDEGEDIGTD